MLGKTHAAADRSTVRSGIVIYATNISACCFYTSFSLRIGSALVNGVAEISMSIVP
jgi:hypothetical protein